MRIIGFDPGKVNFGYSIVDLNGTIEIVNSGLITPATGVHGIPTWMDTVAELIEDFSPKYLVVEQYQYRGRASRDAEINNLMIGSAVATAEYMEVASYLVAPSTWKRWRKANEDLIEKVDALKTYGSDHERDATFIPVWFYYRGLSLATKNICKKKNMSLNDLNDLDHRWRKILVDNLGSVEKVAEKFKLDKEQCNKLWK